MQVVWFVVVAEKVEQVTPVCREQGQELDLSGTRAGVYRLKSHKTKGT